MLVGCHKLILVRVFRNYVLHVYGKKFVYVEYGPVLFAAAAVLEEKDRKEVQGTNLAGTGSGGIGTG